MVTEDDRKRFFELLRDKERLSWEEFWQKWDDDDVLYLLACGG
ncbi:hypothetical protein [Nesterenkonia populi]